MKNRGSSKRALEPALIEYILELRKKNMSIRVIRENLQSKGIEISLYAIWKVISQEELRTYKKILDSSDEVYGIDILYVGGKYLLVLVDVKNDCDVLFMTRINDNRLSTVYDALYPYVTEILKNSKTTPVFVMTRVRPLSLGPEGMNRFTKLVERKGGKVLFLTFTRRSRKFRQKITAQLEKSTTMEEMVKIIRDACKYITTTLTEEDQ